MIFESCGFGKGTGSALIPAVTTALSSVPTSSVADATGLPTDEANPSASVVPTMEPTAPAEPTGTLCPTAGANGTLHPTTEPTGAQCPTAGLTATPYPTVEPTASPYLTAEPTLPADATAPSQQPTQPLPSPTEPPRDPYDLNYWIAKYGPDKQLMTAAGIAKLNKAMLEKPGLGLADLTSGHIYTGQEVYELMAAYSFPDKRILDGEPLTAAKKEQIIQNARIDAILQHRDETINVGYAVATSNSNIRSFPTHSRLTNEEGLYDYLQETRLNLGDPMLVLYSSKDGGWYFVQSGFYAGWVDAREVGLCNKEMFDAYIRNIYNNAEASRVVTKLRHILFVNCSDPADGTDYNYYSPFAGYLRPGTILEPRDAAGTKYRIPARKADGSLCFVTCSAGNENTSYGTPIYDGLEDCCAVRNQPLSVENLLRTAEGLLYEIHYSWGDEYEFGMDCSSTIRSLYSLFGLRLPRNSSAQGKLPVAVRELSALDSSTKTKYIMEQSVGTILYMPGHVMLLLGEFDGKLYVMHNTTNSVSDTGELTQYNMFTITTLDIGRTGQTLLDRITKAVNLFSPE